MGDSDVLQSLADAIGVDSNHDLEVIAKTLSYLNISSLAIQSCKDPRPSFSIPIETGSRGGAVRAQFNTKLEGWRLVPSQYGSSSLGSTVRNSSPERDWTRLLPTTSHVNFLKSRDWESTSLGPMSSWPSRLQLMTMKMLSDPRPANLYVGPDRIAIYNEPFSIIAASRHPFMMGATCEAALPATWPFLSRIFDGIEKSGEAFSAGSFEMSVEKVAGFLEEYFPPSFLSL